MSPGEHGTTRQIRRNARRRIEKARETGGDAKRLEREARQLEAGTSGSITRGEILFVILMSIGSLALMGMALAVDFRSFHAVATPYLYCWVFLCVVVIGGGAIAIAALRADVYVPRYFRIALIAGAVAGIFTVPTAWRILTKEDAQVVTPFATGHLDLRNRIVTDRSFAEQNLRRSELSGATLRHVDLSGADLSESDLRDVRFEDVDLSAASLCGVDLRGADLSGAHGIGAVADWSYVFYNRQTRVPKTKNFVFSLAPGPIPDTGRDLLYMCKQDVTHRIDG